MAAASSRPPATACWSSSAASSTRSTAPCASSARSPRRKPPCPRSGASSYRAGINLGDIVIDGDDILGDGVNIAARLEGLAEPGGISITASVFEQVVGKLDLVFDDTGDRQVKNIQKPLRVYRVRLEMVRDEGDAGARGARRRRAQARRSPCCRSRT